LDSKNISHKMASLYQENYLLFTKPITKNNFQ
jgi:hypothetical protein